jgi:hypothetical protein
VLNTGEGSEGKKCAHSHYHFRSRFPRRPTAQTTTSLSQVTTTRDCVTKSSSPVFNTGESFSSLLSAVYCGHFPLLTARGVPRVVSPSLPRRLGCPFPSHCPWYTTDSVFRLPRGRLGRPFPFVEFIRHHPTGAVTPDHHQVLLAPDCRVSSLNCPRFTAHTFPSHLPRSWFATTFIALRHSLLNLQTVHGLRRALSHYPWYPIDPGIGDDDRGSSPLPSISKPTMSIGGGVHRS